MTSFGSDEEKIDDPSINDNNSHAQKLKINPEIFDENLFKITDDIDLLVGGVYKLWCNWAYFEIQILTPSIKSQEIPSIIHPEIVQETKELEFVYPIFDFGNVLSTSKASDMFSVGSSMCKLYYTIEKMIAIIIDKLNIAVGSGASDDTLEAEISFDGNQLAQRKAFESVINLNHNVVVTNFDPGEWGEKYLQIMKTMAERGYGYPSESPRNIYRGLGYKSSKPNQSA